MTIVNDNSRVDNQHEASLTDDARVIIYDCHMCIVQATDGGRFKKRVNWKDKTNSTQLDKNFPYYKFEKINSLKLVLFCFLSVHWIIVPLLLFLGAIFKSWNGKINIFFTVLCNLMSWKSAHVFEENDAVPLFNEFQ